MKRKMCLGIILMLILFLVACGESNVKSTSTTRTSSDQEQNMEAAQNNSAVNSNEAQKDENKNAENEVVELYPVNIWGKFGYIDKSGNVAIKPQFAYGEKFKDGMARIELDGKYGFIDKIGTVVIKPQYMEAYDFSEGLAAVMTFDNKTMYIDKKGNTVINSSNVFFPYGFSEGLAVCGSNGNVGFMNSSGKVIISPRYSSAALFSEGLAAVLVGKKYGYVNSKGNMVISPQFDYAQDFKDGMAGVLINNKYGFIDTNGKVVIEPQYDAVGKFSEDLASVCINSKWGFIDKSGKTVIGLNYESVQDFSEGLAEVNTKDRSYFIDKTGRPIVTIPRSGDYMPEPFNNGLALIARVEGNYYIDKSGKTVWREPDSFTMDNGAKLVKNVVRNEDGSLVIAYPELDNLKDGDMEKKINSILASDFNTSYKVQQDETYTAKYDIQYIHGSLVNIIENSYSYNKGAAHGMPGRISIILNLKSGESYTLADMFKKDGTYVDKLSQIIKGQIAEKQIPLLNEFKKIDADESFYLNDDGITVYFLPYKYTPYAAGFVEFKIKYSELEDVIDKEGGFFKALN